MRKYQQLILLLISALSVTILLMYKSENNRLKYILQVVNFFGRNDAAVLRRLDNITKDAASPEFVYPMPVWQLIGDSFHAYSAYWIRNELVAGGEAYSIVTGERLVKAFLQIDFTATFYAGKHGAVVNFRCSFHYEGGTRSVQGKFRFQRVDSVLDDSHSEFTIYNFFCRLTRDFGLPESVAFTDITSNIKTERYVRLRHLKSEGNVAPVSICVNLLNYNSTLAFDKNQNNVLQFFLHHQAMGIDNFLVYNEDVLPVNLIHTVRRLNVHLHSLPFNFPFSLRNESQSERLNGIIERDCLLRNSNHAKYTILLSENEFLYSNQRLDHEHSILRAFGRYTANVRRFQVPLYDVCLADNTKLLIDNKFYNPDAEMKHLYIYRMPMQIPLSFPDATTQSIQLTLTNAMAHRYVNCTTKSVSADGPHEWRAKLRKDFLKNLDSIRYEIELLT